MTEGSQELKVKDLLIKLQVLTNGLIEERKKSQNYLSRIKEYEESLQRRELEVANLTKEKFDLKSKLSLERSKSGTWAKDDKPKFSSKMSNEMKIQKLEEKINQQNFELKDYSQRLMEDKELFDQQKIQLQTMITIQNQQMTQLKEKIGALEKELKEEKEKKEKIQEQQDEKKENEIKEKMEKERIEREEKERREKWEKERIEKEEKERREKWQEWEKWEKDRIEKEEKERREKWEKEKREMLEKEKKENEKKEKEKKEKESIREREEKKAKEEKEEKLKIELEGKLRKEIEEKLRKEMEEKLRKEMEEKLRKELENNSQKKDFSQLNQEELINRMNRKFDIERDEFEKKLQLTRKEVRDEKDKNESLVTELDNLKGLYETVKMENNMMKGQIGDYQNRIKILNTEMEDRYLTHRIFQVERIKTKGLVKNKQIMTIIFQWNQSKNICEVSFKRLLHNGKTKQDSVNILDLNMSKKSEYVDFSFNVSIY